MPIFYKGSDEERNIAELFQKFKDNKIELDHTIIREHENVLELGQDDIEPKNMIVFQSLFCSNDEMMSEYFKWNEI